MCPNVVNSCTMSGHLSFLRLIHYCKQVYEKSCDSIFVQTSSGFFQFPKKELLGVKYIHFLKPFNKAKLFSPNLEAVFPPICVFRKCLLHQTLVSNKDYSSKYLSIRQNCCFYLLLPDQWRSKTSRKENPELLFPSLLE